MFLWKIKKKIKKKNEQNEIVKYISNKLEQLDFFIYSEVTWIRNTLV